MTRKQWFGGWYDRHVCSLLMKYGYYWADAEVVYRPDTYVPIARILYARSPADAERGFIHTCELPDINEAKAKEDFLKVLEVRLKFDAGSPSNT